MEKSKNERIKIKGYQIGPLFIGRRGRYIFMENRSTEKEFKESLKRFAEWHSKLSEIIKSNAQKLEELILQFNPLDIIANLILLNLFTNPETYKEYSFKGKQPYVEYCTLLCLKKNYEEGNRFKILGREIEDIQKLIVKIFMDTLWYYATEHIDPKSPNSPTPLEVLRFETVICFLMTRNPGYYHHLENLLRDLFRVNFVKNWMIENLGFDIETMIKSSNAIIKLMEERLLELRKNVWQEKLKILNELENYKKTGKVKDIKYKQIIEKINRFNLKSQTTQIDTLLGAWIVFTLGDAFTFGADDLVKMVGYDLEQIQKFLDIFSISFGEVDKNFYIPEPVHILQTRPIIKYSKGYFYSVPGMLLWSLKPRIEEIMKNDQTFWNKYEKLRHNYLLQKSLEFFNNIFQSKAQIYSNLKYDNNELDGLIIFDRNCFLIEVKGGELTPRSKKGFFDRLKKDIKALIKEAHEQTLKAKNYIDSSKQAIFKNNKRELIFPKDKIDSYFLIIISLDALDSFTVNVPQLQDAGLLSKQNLPWAVSFLDFRVISEIIEFPTQFIHYLKRRLRINDIAKIKAHDELDFFMNYLKEGLYYEKGMNDFSFLQLDTYTTELDDYYAYKTGQRKTKVDKPKQPMPKLFYDLIHEIENKGGDGHTKVIEALLEMDGNSREKIIELFEIQKTKVKKDGRLHDFTMTVGSNQIGYTWFIAKDDEFEKLFRKLISYCTLKKYQTRASYWVGLISLIKYPGIIHGWIFDNYSWQFDPKFEKFIQTLPFKQI